MDTFETLYNTISLSGKQWSTPFFCEGQTSKDGPIMMLDICQHMERTVCNVFQKGYLHPDSSFLFNPNKFVGVESKNDLVLYLIACARSSGFELMLCRKTSRSNATKRKKYTLVLKCRHNQLTAQTNGNMNDSENENNEMIEGNGTPMKKKRKAKTTFSANSRQELCPFKLKVICNTEDNLWYLLFRDLDQEEIDLGWNHCCHMHHLKLNPQHIPLSMKELKNSFMPLINSCVSAGLDTPQIASMCSQANSKETVSKGITASQIEYMRGTYKNIGSKILGLKGDMSSAEKVIDMMNKLINNGMDLDYRVLVHSSNHELTIRSPKGRPKKVSGSSINLSIGVIRESLKLNEGTDVLLALAWVSGEEKELIKRFPHLISADVTERTNAEKRSLYLFTGLDGNNKIFPALHCFMPNCSSEQYGWIYEYAFPDLVGKDVVKRNEVFITDGETAMYETLENLKGTSSPWSSTTLFRCTYHMFTQVWAKTVGGKEKKKVSMAVLNEVKRFFEFMMYNVQ